MGWTQTYKWTVTLTVATATLAVALASSAYTGATSSLQQHFGASTLLITGGLSLFVLGFALGPLFWAVRLRYSFPAIVRLTLAFSLVSGPLIFYFAHADPIGQ